MNPVNTTRWGHVEILSRDFTSAELDAAISRRQPGVVAKVPLDAFVRVFYGEGGIKKAMVNFQDQAELIQNRTSGGSLDTLFMNISRFFTDKLPHLLLKNHRAE